MDRLSFDIHNLVNQRFLRRQLVREMGEELLYGSEKSEGEWLRVFTEYFDKFCRHSIGGTSIDSRYEKLKKEDPEMAGYFTEILLSHPEGISLLSDEKKLRMTFAECKKRIQPNQEIMEKILKKYKKELTKGDEAGLRMFLQSKILFFESKAFQEMPEVVQELLFERILSGADDAALAQEVEWLNQMIQRIARIDFTTVEQRRTQRNAEGGDSISTLMAEKHLPKHTAAELLMFLYINHRGEEMTGQQIVQAFQSLGERHLLMNELLDEHTALLMQEEDKIRESNSPVDPTKMLRRLEAENPEHLAEWRKITEAMAVGIYTMQETEFEELLSCQADYLKASIEADQIFEEQIAAQIQDKEERRLLKIGLREYFHADILKGWARLDKDTLRSGTQRMLKDEKYLHYLKNSDSLTGSVSNTSLTDQERTLHTTANRGDLEAFLAEKKNKKFRIAYNRLNLEQRQVFALSVLQTDRVSGEDVLSSMRYIHSDELEKARRMGIEGQLHRYMSHEDFQPVIPYDQVLDILKRADGTMDEAAFEKAMEQAQAHIRRYQDQIPRDFARLADGAASIQEAARLSRKKNEPAHGRQVPQPVKTLQELRERILELDDLAPETMLLKRRLEKASNYELRIIAAALEDRTLLDRTTRITQRGRKEVVNPEKREALKSRLLGDTDRTRGAELNERSLTRALTTLMSYQLRDDVDLTGRELSKKDFAKKVLSRETLIDWALFQQAMDFADEVLTEELLRSKELQDLEKEIAITEEAEQQVEEETQELTEEEQQQRAEEIELQHQMQERRI